MISAVMFQGPPFLKVGGSLGPQFHNFRSNTVLILIILSLHIIFSIDDDNEENIFY